MWWVPRTDGHCCQVYFGQVIKCVTRALAGFQFVYYILHIWLYIYIYKVRVLYLSRHLQCDMVIQIHNYLQAILSEGKMSPVGPDTTDTGDSLHWWNTYGTGAKNFVGPCGWGVNWQRYSQTPRLHATYVQQGSCSLSGHLFLSIGGPDGTSKSRTIWHLGQCASSWILFTPRPHIPYPVSLCQCQFDQTALSKNTTFHTLVNHFLYPWSPLRVPGEPISGHIHDRPLLSGPRCWRDRERELYGCGRSAVDFQTTGWSWMGFMWSTR